MSAPGMSDGLRILFVSTWAADSGLSSATVHPHLEVLASDSRVRSVHYISMESSPSHGTVGIEGVMHEPVIDRGGQGVLGKALNHRRRMAAVYEIAKRVRPDLVICRGAPAGVFGIGLGRKLNVPFYVESFEPHADRMIDAAIWRRSSLKYLVQRRWEERCKREAAGLITVSDGYARHLTNLENVAEHRIMSVPCWVDPEKFYFDPRRRAEIRSALGIDSATVCVYVGKFGGLYYDQEAFAALGVIAKEVGDSYFLIVLTPTDSKRVRHGLERFGTPRDKTTVMSVPHSEVHRYLSAADFAVSFPRSTRWSFTCSPIKHAEYWACGLPTLIPSGVGDESGWVEQEKLGVVMDVGDVNSLRSGVHTVLSRLNLDQRQRIRESALDLRGRKRLEDAYDKVLSRHG